MVDDDGVENGDGDGDGDDVPSDVDFRVLRSYAKYRKSINAGANSENLGDGAENLDRRDDMSTQQENTGGYIYNKEYAPIP